MLLWKLPAAGFAVLTGLYFLSHRASAVGVIVTILATLLSVVFADIDPK